MNSGELFSVLFVSYDKKRKTGGILKKYDQVKLSNPKIDKNKPARIDGSSPVRKANHFINSTRTIRVYKQGIDSGLVKKMHIFLMLQINGKKVIL